MKILISRIIVDGESLIADSWLRVLAHACRVCLNNFEANTPHTIGDRRFSRLILIFLCFLLFCFPAFSRTSNPAIPLIKIKKGSSILLQGEGEHAKRFQWFKDGEPLINETGLTLSASEAGIYTVIAFNAANCTEVSAPVEVTVEEQDVNHLTDLQVSLASDSKQASIGDPFEYQVDLRNNGAADATDVTVTDILPEGLLLAEIFPPATGKTSYNASSRMLTWTVDRLPANHTASFKFLVKASKKGSIKNSVQITGQAHNMNPANNYSAVLKDIRGLDIPNVITPNGDNKNERFEIPNLQDYADSELTILNRWGSQVYSCKSYQNEWNGKDLNEGTYFYVLKLKTNQGEWKAHKGYVTLLKGR